MGDPVSQVPVSQVSVSQVPNSQVNEDEIDLRELFASLWAGKFVIGVVTALALAGAVVYALTEDEEYQSAAVFELKSQQSGPRLPSQYSDLAALAGLGGLGQQSQGVFDRLAGRDFVGRLAADLDLASDPYFNPPEGDDPSALTAVKDSVQIGRAHVRTPVTS